ncbi:RDD family protein [Nocardioides marmoribigeumensis]|jgi:uncharacterized RDD family membrane protein YckC|uniref:RDD family membrane protein YckC n=1 Tax=Nocardioides marmoribigeumensis TaxID=433649 RepID=A0ABU2BW68_9ACTN|nr:RDD family protein [Nocardioides marmoribigeumensis]MDR7362264.1 putative RDD family membrane protein YckC [Nocardioides marmoribigeumensis]
MSNQSDPPAWGDPPASGDQGGSSAPPPPPPPPPGYGQGYGQAGGYGDPYADPYAQQGAGLAYAHWGKRVGAYLVDLLVAIPAYVVIGIGIAIAGAGARATTDPTTGVQSVEGGNAVGIVIAVIGYVLIFAILLWNTVFRQGRTGWSIGKQALGIRLVKEDSGEPMGAGLCFVRMIVHIVDGIPCYLGYLWPLWDAKKQTFADKIMSTVVVEQRKA